MDRGMKAILLSLAIALLMVGCGEADLSDPDVVEDVTADAVEWSKLQDRSGVTYLPNTKEPYSGYAGRTYENGQLQILARFKDGYVVRVKEWWKNGTPRWDIGVWIRSKVGIDGFPGKVPRQYLHGTATLWHENGQKKSFENYKYTMRDGPVEHWYDNGQKKLEGNYKDNKLDGLLTFWYESGQKGSEENLLKGKLMSAEIWKPNGEKCPLTNVKDGNGVAVLYNEDGTESFRKTYKDGEPVED